MNVSSRTPEGSPNICPVCLARVVIEPSFPPGDAPCPHCGVLLWFAPTSAGLHLFDLESIRPLRDTVAKIVGHRLGVPAERVLQPASFIEDMGADSLDLVELVMELEEELGVTIPDDEARGIKTVGEAIACIERRLP